MPDTNLESLTVFCSSIEDTTLSIDKESGGPVMEITLTDVDILDVISDIGMDNLLAAMSEESVMTYFREIKIDEEGVERAKN